MTIDRSPFGEAHVKRYVETDGEVGYIWNGAPTLILAAASSARPRSSSVATASGSCSSPRREAGRNEIWPHYDEYQAKTTRTIPVVVLDRL